MADAADLKSAEGFLLYGFDSRLRHHFGSGFRPLGGASFSGYHGNLLSAAYACFESIG